MKPDCILCRSKRFRVGSSGLQWVLLLCKEPFDGGGLWWSLWFSFIPFDSSALLAAVQALRKRVIETSSLAVSLCFALNSHLLSQFSTQILPGLYQWREERGGSRRILWMWFVACGYWRISNFGVTSVGWFKGASAIVLFMSHELSSCIIDYTSVIVINFNFNYHQLSLVIVDHYLFALKMVFCNETNPLWSILDIARCCGTCLFVVAQVFLPGLPVFETPKLGEPKSYIFEKSVSSLVWPWLLC